MEAYNKRSKTLLSKGQSLFEVVIAMALVSVVLISLVSLATLSIKASVFSRNQTQASQFTQEGVEWLTAEKSASWSAFRTLANTHDWCLATKSWTHPGTCGSLDKISGTIFIRSLHFTVNSDGSVTADVSTTWTDANGNHTVPASNIFASWK